MLESYINKIIKFAFKAFKAKKHRVTSTFIVNWNLNARRNAKKRKSLFFPAVVDCKVHNYKAQSEYNYPSQNLRLYDGHELCRIQVLSCEVSNRNF